MPVDGSSHLSKIDWHDYQAIAAEKARTGMLDTRFNVIDALKYVTYHHQRKKTEYPEIQ